jgi:hypothetical protein
MLQQGCWVLCYGDAERLGLLLLLLLEGRAQLR